MTELKRILFFLIFLPFVSFVSNSQEKTFVYYTAGIIDSTTEVVHIFETQLRKVFDFNFTELKGKLYKGKGILFSSDKTDLQRMAPELTRMGPEAVKIKSGKSTLVILGNSQMALKHAMFIYLEHLGFRYYFPHPDWYIIPSGVDLCTTFSYVGEPSFSHRRIWCGYGPGNDKANKDYDFWFAANRQGGAMNANFGHAWDDIMYRNAEEFKRHPDWFYPQPQKGTLPGDPKFNVVSEELSEFIINDFLQRIEQSKKSSTPLYKMISFGPSDGLGNCDSPKCREIGSITDRVYYLTNKVAAAIRKKYPDSWIGSMAYSEYISPPSIKLEPNIFVAITTAFNYSKYSTEQLIKLWSAKAKKTGIYDYFSIYTWDNDVPGQSLASDPNQVAERIKKYYKLGSRAYEAETTTGWISKGLGHYVAARLMWDVNLNLEKIQDEFYSLCFGRSAIMVKELFNNINKNSNSSPSESDLAGWIDNLGQIEKNEIDEKVKNRLFHVKLYLYYLTQFRNYKRSASEESLVKLLNYCYRMLDYGAFAGYPALFDFGNTTSFSGMKFDDPNAKWKSKSIPYTKTEINNFLNVERKSLKKIEGLMEFPLNAGFATIKYKGLGKNISTPIPSIGLWMPHDFIIQIDKKGKENYVEIDGDWVMGGGSNKPITISLYKYRWDDNYQRSPIFYYEYKLKQVKKKVSLENIPPGFYLLKLYDPTKIFNLYFSNSLKYSLLLSGKRKLNTTFTNNLYLYVPKGVKKFGIWKSIEIKMITPTGRIIDLLNKKNEEVEIPVYQNEEGLWKIIYFSGSMSLKGLPPVLGIHPGKMLIPTNIN